MKITPTKATVHVYGTRRLADEVRAALSQRRADASVVIVNGTEHARVPVEFTVRHHWRPWAARVDIDN